MTLIVPAYAKINLFLDVVGKRDNGYHDIVSVMQSVSLCDTLTVSRTEGIDITVRGGGLPGDETNLIVRAARAYFARSAAPFGVSVVLDKQIPMAAGLGGGSADAAAMLKALNTLDGNRFTVAELAAIGAGIGADVPFCVHGGTCLCKGIGEVITPIKSAARTSFVIAIAGEGVSTPAAFAMLDQRYQNYVGFADTISPETLIDAIQKGDASLTVLALFNRFEEVIMAQRPAVSQIKELLVKHGALAAQMSGSGPAVFGVFSDAEVAAKAAASLTSVGIRAYACETLV